MLSQFIVSMSEEARSISSKKSKESVKYLIVLCIIQWVILSTILEQSLQGSNAVTVDNIKHKRRLMLIVLDDHPKTVGIGSGINRCCGL